jgi:hypothetical protein
MKQEMTAQEMTAQEMTAQEMTAGRMRANCSLKARALSLITLCVSVLGGLSSCENVNIINTSLDFDVYQCVSSEQASSIDEGCVNTLNDTLSTETPNTCLILRKVNNNEETEQSFALEAQWADGVLSPVGGDTVELNNGDQIRTELYFFKRDITSPACSVEVGAPFEIEAPCTEDWCALKLKNPRVQLETETIISFQDVNGACLSEGPTCAKALLKRAPSL